MSLESLRAVPSLLYVTYGFLVPSWGRVASSQQSSGFEYERNITVVSEKSQHQNERVTISKYRHNKRLRPTKCQQLVCNSSRPQGNALLCCPSVFSFEFSIPRKANNPHSKFQRLVSTKANIAYFDVVYDQTNHRPTRSRHRDARAVLKGGGSPIEVQR